MLNSDLYRQVSPREWLHSIMPVENMPSVMEHGILSHNKMRYLPHCSIAKEGVQNRRDNKSVPRGMALHDYANLYFNPRNAMMYARHEMFNSICVLLIDPCVLDWDNVVVSDGNAASDVTRFFMPSDGLRRIDFEAVNTIYWNDPDPYLYEAKKRVVCAEVLVPYQVPYCCIQGAYVATKTVGERLLSIGFDRGIHINRNIFFC